MIKQDSYDTIIIGGGPAGSTVASLVAKAGYRTLLLEREKMPRFHVGESLMPETYWVFERLGLLDKMKHSSFVKKVSVQFVSHSGKESQPFYFEEHDPRECSSTWQVERAEFDKMLFDHAAEQGAECLDGTRVLDILFDGDRAAGVEIQTEQGQRRKLTASVIVDASGQQSLIANRLGIRVADPDLKKVAIWGYYKNARRDEGDNGGATIIMQTQQKQSWFWFIPLSNGITSIGVVGDHDYLLKRGAPPEQVYEDELVKCPAMTERLMHAEMVGEFHVAKEFSYRTTQHSGPGWVLVGDAFGFIDPIYSSGVYFALQTGMLAADAIVAGLAKGDTSGDQLGQWVDDFKEGASWIRKLVRAYYTDQFSFGGFMKQHPEHRGNLTDLLIGRIFYEGAGEIFNDMDPAIQRSIETREADADSRSQSVTGVESS